MKYASLLAVLLLACCGGCGGGGGTVNTGNSTGNGGISNSIVGRWAATSIQGPDGTTRDCPASIDVGDATFACGLIDTQIYRSDGSYADLNVGQNGTWTASGDRLRVTSNGQTRVFTYVVNGALLTEQQSSSGGPVTITYQRQ